MRVPGHPAPFVHPRPPPPWPAGAYLKGLTKRSLGSRGYDSCGSSPSTSTRRTPPARMPATASSKAGITWWDGGTEVGLSYAGAG